MLREVPEFGGHPVYLCSGKGRKFLKRFLTEQLGAKSNLPTEFHGHRIGGPREIVMNQ